MWKEIAELKGSDAQYADKETLPDVLVRIPVPGRPYANLLEWVKDLERIEPWRDNGFVAWRAVSGIFAANATGAVSFRVGSGITRAEKVFAATEIGVLARNPKVDALTRDILAYYQRCLQSGQADMNFGFVAG
jgi:hypothetical protein